MSVHLRLDGRWVQCHATQRACPRRIHLHDMTLQAIQTAPEDMLLPILNIIDTPTIDFGDGNLLWQDVDGEAHRDHDLPAVYYEQDGLFEWHQHGELHRAGDKPAVVHRGQERAWYRLGVLHRGGGKPAVINENGLREWWYNGELLRREVSHAR